MTAPRPEQITTGPGRRWKAIAAVVGLMAGLVALLAVGGDDQPDDAITSEIRQVPATSDTATPTTRSARITVPPTEPVRVEPLVLGEPSGLWLFYGGEDPLQRLDLDSGALDLYGLRVRPLAAVGDQLILEAANGTIGWVGLDDPGEQAQGWQPARPARGEQPGLLWMLFDDDPPNAVLVDVMTDTIIERRPLPDERLPAAGAEGGRARLVPGPDLVSTAAGVELFDDDDGDGDGDGYRQVGDGRILAFDADRALIERCDGATPSCERRWFDRNDWQPTVAPVPFSLDETLAAGPVLSAELLAGGRWLSIVDADARPFLFSLDPERPLEPIKLLAAATFTVSPDGRWLAVTSRFGEETAVEVLDLDADTRVAVIDAFIGPSGGELLFVERR